MLHRRLAQDDKMGMNEALNDTHTLHVSMKIVFGTVADCEERRHSAQLLLEEPVVVLSLSPISPSSSSLLAYAPVGSYMLPANIQLLSLATALWHTRSSNDSKQQQVVMRLRHMHELKAHAKLSRPVRLNINTLLVPDRSRVQATAEERSIHLVTAADDVPPSRWFEHAFDDLMFVENTNMEDFTIQPARVHSFYMSLAQPREPVPTPTLPPLSDGDSHNGDDWVVVVGFVGVGVSIAVLLLSVAVLARRVIQRGKIIGEQEMEVQQSLMALQSYDADSPDGV